MDKSKLIYRLLLRALDNEKTELNELKKFFKNDPLEKEKINAQLQELKIVEKIINEVFNYGW